MRGLLAFWLVRWAWTQFTWTLNSADTRHRVVELATVVATAAAFLTAHALPTAFDDGQGLWSVVPYVTVRTVGLWLHLAISRDDPDQRVWLAVIVADLVAGGVGCAAGCPARRRRARRPMPISERVANCVTAERRGPVGRLGPAGRPFRRAARPVRHHHPGGVL